MISKYTKGSGFGLNSLKNVFSRKENKYDEVDDDRMFRTGELSGGDLNPRVEEADGEKTIKVGEVIIEKFVPLRDWRKP
jgi:hypothetical protein